MSKSLSESSPEKAAQDADALSRRDFVATGAVAVSALSLSPAQAAEPTRWDKEADVVVIGGGAGGLVAGIAAREKGASVIIVEKNFDIGGRAMMSFGGLYIGGGNRLQKALAQGRTPGKEDTPDKVFEDWSRPEKPMGRFSDRQLVRVYADNNLDLFEWLEKHGIRWEGYRPAPDRLDRNRTRLNVIPWPNEITGPARGPGFVRPLAKTAREMGIEILLQQQMTKIHREAPLSGRVTGISVIEVDDMYNKKTTTMNIRARKGVIVATGGSAGNPYFRTMFDVRLTEEYQAENSEWTQRTADGEIAAMEIGAALGATACQTTQDDNLLNKGRMGKKSNGSATELYPTAPHFFRARAVGIEVEDFQNIILVKENGLRFYKETADTRDYEYYAAALAWTGDPKKMNGGGPIWAIFDADAVAREKWNVAPPHVDPSGYFFTAGTIEGLAKSIVNEYQWRPMPPDALKRTVERYNSFVDAGVDADFAKPRPRYKIAKPPFYAAWHTPALHDSYTGIRINTNGQVLDLRGNVIPGLYACGDSAGGFGQHGICRAATYGRLGGWHAATQQI
jgi:succinate dehydrogenase/fumarate reductase flavoprotein subunit